MSWWRTTSAASLLFIGGAWGCAQVEAPPGGPPDNLPPSLASTRPENDVVLDSYRGAVVFVFDERISEQGLQDAVMVSPRTSPVEVRHGRDELRVSLRRGWESGRIYHVVLRPVVSDLFGNRLLQPARLVFSTGPAIPDTWSAGTVIDRVTGRPAMDVRVEAIRTTDSLVYAVPTDTAGAFQFEKIPEGNYSVRAYEDVNRNRTMDPFEPQDSALLRLVTADSTELVLRLLMPDSTPPVAASAGVREELVQIEFDDYLDPEQVIDLGQVSLTGPGGTIPINGVAIIPTVSGTGDPTGQAGAGQPGGQPPAPPGGPQGPAAQTSGERLPSRTLVLELSAASDVEAPGDYVVGLTGIRNVNGLSGSSEITFTVEAVDPPDVAFAFPHRSTVATLEPRK